MTKKEGIRRLQEHLKKARRWENNANIWFNSGVKLVSEVFGPDSEESISFLKHSIIYREKQPDADQMRKQLEKSYVYINSLISELNEQYKSELEADGERNSERSIVGDQSENTKVMSSDKNRTTYTIGVGLFWGVAIPLASGIFYMGTLAGNIKYDTDKINLSDNNKMLKDSLSWYHKNVQLKDTGIKRLSEELRLSKDSLVKLKEDYHNMGVYAGSLQQQLDQKK